MSFPIVKEECPKSYSLSNTMFSLSCSLSHAISSGFVNLSYLPVKNAILMPYTCLRLIKGGVFSP